MGIKGVFLTLLVMSISAFSLYSQEEKQKKIRLSGYVYDLKTKETLIGAAFYEPKSKAGTISNNYGFFSFAIPQGEMEIIISYIGYEKVILKYNFSKDTSINIFLKPTASQLQGVLIEDNAISKRFIDEPTPGKMVINPMTIISMPSLTGESDLLKSLQLLPGVKSGTEGTTGLYVRGGNLDQNLYLIDGIPIYNPNHLMGFISTFNTDAIKNIEFYKGVFPARYGGRVSSVVDIRMKDGNSEKIRGEASIGLISAKLNVEGPIFKSNEGVATTFSISGRRTYIDLITKPFIAYANSNNGSDVDFNYFFTDVNLKVNHKFSPSNRLMGSFYWGEDKFKFGADNSNSIATDKNTSQVKWGNLIGTIDWAYEISNRLFSNLSLSYNRYRSNINSIYENKYKDNSTENNYKFEFNFLSGIEDWSVKNEYNFYLNGWNSLTYGMNYTYHTYSPELTSILSNEVIENLSQYNVNNRVYGNELVFFLEDEMNFTERFSMDWGLHYNIFNVSKTTYHSLQPRFGLRYSINKDFSIKAGYSMMNQNIHLLANGILSAPTDLWVPVTDKVKPITSHQVSAGAFYQLKDWANISLEGYYKRLNNVIDYKDGVSTFNSSGNWENKIAQGFGDAYGIEFMAHREKGNTTGWFSYTLAWAFREFPNGEINAGKRYYDRYDSRHQINIVLSHKFNDNIDITAAWVFHSGNRATVPIATYYTPIEMEGENQNSHIVGRIIDVYGERNNYVLPSYHRLDIGINFSKKLKHGLRIWSINVYNLYNRKNVFFVAVADKPNKLKAYSIMPIIPTISYTYKFN